MIKKTFFIIFLFSLTLGFLVGSNAFANKTSISSYYPSPSGHYTKVQVVNTGGSFCSSAADAGKISTDPATGYLQICNKDSNNHPTISSYPGACFNRFASGNVVATASCPSNYKVAPGSAHIFSLDSSNTSTAWSCCFTGQGAGVTASAITKSGCFSLYSANSSTQPATCSSVDTNAYEVSCEQVVGSGNTVFKRNCCFNFTSGTYAQGINPDCGLCTRTDCVGSWGACSGGAQTYSITTPASCGGNACPFAPGATQSCTNCVGAWGGCSGGLETYTVTTPASGGGTPCSNATGDTQSCGTACTGHWDPCVNGSQTFHVDSAATGGGAACPATDGTTQTCGVACVGDWGACSGSIQIYTITTPASGGGLNCAYVNGATQACGGGPGGGEPSCTGPSDVVDCSGHWGPCDGASRNWIVDVAAQCGGAECSETTSMSCSNCIGGWMGCPDAVGNPYADCSTALNYYHITQDAVNGGTACETTEGDTKPCGTRTGDCGGKNCGEDDGCGTPCDGPCTFGSCGADHACHCNPGATCGGSAYCGADDGCGGTCQYGICDPIIAGGCEILPPYACDITIPQTCIAGTCVAVGGGGTPTGFPVGGSPAGSPVAVGGSPSGGGATGDPSAIIDDGSP